MLKLTPIKVGYYEVEKNYGAIIVTPVFSSFRLSKNVKKFFFEIVELIDGNTGILCQKFSDKRIVPLSKKQIEIFVNDRNVGDALDELVAYGILARIDVSRTEFYVANPYIVNKGEHINPFLLSIFNSDTLKKMDKYNISFELLNRLNSTYFGRKCSMLNEIELTPSLNLKLRKAKTEFLSSDNNISAEEMAENYALPISALKEIMKKEKWENERDTYRQDIINEVRRKKENLQSKASLNTLSQAVSLQNTIFKKVKEDIDAGRYIPTVKDFTEIAKITSPVNKSEGGNVNSNNRIVHLNFKKPVEEMTYEEILAVESELDRKELNEHE